MFVLFDTNWCLLVLSLLLMLLCVDHPSLDQPSLSYFRPQRCVRAFFFCWKKKWLWAASSTQNWCVCMFYNYFCCFVYFVLLLARPASQIRHVVWRIFAAFVLPKPHGSSQDPPPPLSFSSFPHRLPRRSDPVYFVPIFFIWFLSILLNMFIYTHG